MQFFEALNPLVQTQKVVEILSGMGSQEYVLMLSGGQSPRELYTFLSHAFNVKLPRVVAQVDERWKRDKFHPDSNSSVVRDSGLLGRLSWESVEWLPILTELSNPILESERYEKDLINAFARYQDRVVAIMGMGIDGHTAGILPDSPAVTADANVLYYRSDDKYKDRITVTISCIRRYFKKIILLLNTQEKLDFFKKVMETENDIDKYPILVFKDHPDLLVLHTQ